MQVTSDILLSGSTNNAVNTVVAQEEFISNMTGNTDLLSSNIIKHENNTYIYKINLINTTKNRIIQDPGALNW